MRTIFITREEELKTLEDTYASGKPEPVTIHRRRIGKTYMTTPSPPAKKPSTS